MATKSNLAVLVQGCLLLMTGAVATVSLVGIGMLSPGCSPRNKLISKMDTWGVSTVVESPPGRKLVNAMWKGSDLWILIRPAGEGEKPDQEWMLDEYSTWGAFNNHILLKETPK